MIDNAEWLHAVEGGGEVGLCYDDQLVNARVGFVRQWHQAGDVLLIFVVEVALESKSGVVFAS